MKIYGYNLGVAKLKKVFVIVSVLLFLVSCKTNEENGNLKWFPSKEEAIEAGLRQESAESKSILDIIEENGETLVFYEMFNGLGVANIAKGPKGFGWYRSSAYIDFQTDSEDSPFMYGGFDIQTYSGITLSVIAGKVYDKSIKKLLLKNNGNEKELQIYGKSRFFFSTHDSEFNSLEVVPVNK